MFGWNGASDDVAALISRKKYPKAIKLLREQLSAHPANSFKRQQLADLLAREGQSREALEMLEHMAREFVDMGFNSKAIAILKKMQRIDPEIHGIEAKVVDLIHQKEKNRQSAQEPTHYLEISTLDEEEELVVQKGRVADESPHRQAELPAHVTALESPLFQGFSQEELLAYIRGLNLLVFEAGEIVCSESERGQALYVLVSGLLRVYVRNREGHNEQVRLLEPGSFFGEISLLSGEARTATITCATFCELLELDMQALTAISREHPKVPEVVREYYQRRRNSPEEQTARDKG